MAQQVLISIGREFGSGGHEVARQLSKRLGLPLYDENMLDEISKERQTDVEALAQYDEAPRWLVFSRVVNGFNNAPEAIVSNMVFDFIRERAESGESFIVLGRCGEEILREYPGLISLFVLADEEFKLERTMARDDTSEHEALALMMKTDRRRSNYHNQFCQKKWGDAQTYDLTINSARLGIEGTVDVLEKYILARKALLED